jgi:ribonuclease BN (tRNA processing enzyme)
MDSVAKRLPLEEVLCPAEDGQEISLSGLRLRAFAVDHSVPTLGWSIALKGEEQPRLVFAADGDPRQFRERPELLRAQVAVVECTYVEENRRVAARLSQHAHLWDWVELAPSIPAKTLVLAHLPETLPPLSHFRPLQEAFPGDLVLWTSPVAGKKGSFARP